MRPAITLQRIPDEPEHDGSVAGAAREQRLVHGMPRDRCVQYGVASSRMSLAVQNISRRGEGSLEMA